VATTEHDQDHDHAGARARGRGAAGAGSPPLVRPRRERRRIATAVSVFGELLITSGLVLALFVVYSLWWTNVIADRQEHGEADAVRKAWSGPQTPGALDIQGGVGFLHVPAMGPGYQVLVKKGTSVNVLNQGVAGYYTSPYQSAMPWDKTGNVALAAHRDGHGAKFHNIDKIKVGDAIVFETRDTWYIYKVYDILAQTSKYNVKVVQPVPRESGKSAAGRYITLTTCTPVYTSLYRYIVWGELVRTQAVDAQRTPPAELR
jgi:LPXTG-site transpeptidase (sortase) family protein